MKSLFYIVIACVSIHALSFTYIKGMKTVVTEGIELEDMSEESDNAEEDIEDAKEHCPYCNPFITGELFLISKAVRTQPAQEFIISHILPVECPPPRA